MLRVTRIFTVGGVAVEVFNLGRYEVTVGLRSKYRGKKVHEVASRDTTYVVGKCLFTISPLVILSF
jgi:hypothetical protein